MPTPHPEDLPSKATKDEGFREQLEPQEKRGFRKLLKGEEIKGMKKQKEKEN